MLVQLLFVKDFLNSLLWLIRRSTMAIILSVYDQKTLNKPKFNAEEIAERMRSFQDWLLHGRNDYFASLKRLRSPSVLHYIHYLKDGSSSMLPCCMKLWTSFPGAIPDETTDPHLFGIMWLPLPAKFMENPSVPDFNSLHLRTISFFDMTDITVEVRRAPLPAHSPHNSTASISASLSSSFPRCMYCSTIFSTGEGNSGPESDVSVSPNTNGNSIKHNRSSSLSALAFKSHVCNGRTNIVLNVKCRYGNSIDFLLCCLDGVSASDSKVVEASGWQLVSDLRSIMDYIDVNQRIRHHLKTRSSVLMTDPSKKRPCMQVGTGDGVDDTFTESLLVSTAVDRIEHVFQY